MTRQPSLEPNSSQSPQSLNNKSLGPSETSFSAQDEADVINVARMLAAHGGGSLAFDLALDLVLNEVVDDAIAATGATGAAIAFARDGEMVCRASAGAEAPELGVRLETKSGLSGACLQSGSVQRCDDSETDTRVSADACRQLGVRSILMMPLSRGNETFGILQLFSAQPNAFGEREETVLQSLVKRIVENKKAAEDGPAILERAGEQTDSSAKENEFLDELRRVSTSDEEGSRDEDEKPTADVLTSVLSVLVIVAAVALGLLIGWRTGAVRAFHGGQHKNARLASMANASPAADSAANQTTPTAEPATPDISGSQANKSNGPKAEPSAGGLVVTENGKVIFRQAPAKDSRQVQKALPNALENSGPLETSSPGGKLEVSSEISESLLIHRVEPEYPLEARTQRIQGLVVLEVEVGKDGTVRNISAVSGDPILTEAATAAVKEWKYRPYVVAGKPVEMQTRVTMQFSLPPS